VLGGRQAQPFFAVGIYLVGRDRDNRLKPKRSVDRVLKRASREASGWGVNWFVWRIVVSTHIPDGFSQVSAWDLPSLLQAHAALDCVEEVQEFQHREATKPQKKPPFRR
jgi:hypothetical protein